MWKRHIDLPTKSITFNRCWITMTIWKRHSHMLPCKAATILTLQKFSTYYPLPINGEIILEPILYASTIARTSHSSAPCHHTYIIWERLMSAECAEVWNWPHPEMHQKILQSPTLDSYSVQKLKRTGDTKLVDWVLRYDQNVLLDWSFIKLQNGLSYPRQPFHCPTSVERLGLDCKVEYTNANQGIMPESHNIWVQYTNSDLDNTFQGRVLSLPELYFSYTLPHHILPFQVQLPSGTTISTFSKRCENTEQWIIRPQVQE